MKRLFILLLFSSFFFNASAFDWKPQTNEELRNDMFLFVEKFIDATGDNVVLK